MLNRHEQGRAPWPVAAIACAAFGLAVAGTAAAQNEPFRVGVDVASLSPRVPQTLQMLLELDAQRALEEETRKMQGPGANISTTGPSVANTAPSESKATSSIAPPRILAITGVGHQLHVHVEREGRRAQFRAGGAEPVGGADIGLRLQAVSQPCASFVNQAQDLVTYCLNRGKQ